MHVFDAASARRHSPLGRLGAKHARARPGQPEVPGRTSGVVVGVNTMTSRAQPDGKLWQTWTPRQHGQTSCLEKHMRMARIVANDAERDFSAKGRQRGGTVRVPHDRHYLPTPTRPWCIHRANDLNARPGQHETTRMSGLGSPRCIRRSARPQRKGGQTGKNTGVLSRKELGMFFSVLLGMRSSICSGWRVKRSAKPQTVSVCFISLNLKAIQSFQYRGV